MSRTNEKEQLDIACYNLQVIMHNPYAIARYLAKPKQIEQNMERTWKELARKKHVHYC